VQEYTGRLRSDGEPSQDAYTRVGIRICTIPLSSSAGLTQNAFMTADLSYNIAGLLIIVAAVAIIYQFWTCPSLLAKFRKDFQDALDDGRGPPESSA
jgi:hypothetical protein